MVAAIISTGTPPSWHIILFWTQKVDHCSKKIDEEVQDGVETQNGTQKRKNLVLQRVSKFVCDLFTLLVSKTV
jgi:hypothetical protein